MSAVHSNVEDSQSEAGSDGFELTAENEEFIAAANRRRFVVMRLVELQERIKAFVVEREELTKTLESGPKEFKPTELKMMRERRTYSSTRLKSLRAEQKALAEERKTLG